MKTNENPFFDYDSEIDNLDFNRAADGTIIQDKKQRLSGEQAAILREVLHDLRDASIFIGGNAVKVGIKILDFIFESLKLFPHVAAGLIIIAILHHIASGVPWVGGFLNTILAPIDVVVIGISLIQDVLGEESLKKMCSNLEKTMAFANV